MKYFRVLYRTGMIIFLLGVVNLFAQAPDTLWTKIYGGTDNDYGNEAQQTFDNGYIVVGGTYSFGAGDCDVYLIKTDIAGDTLWTRTYGGTDTDWSNSVRQTSDGGYIMAGRTWSFGAGLADVYLIKTDTAGDTLWTRTYGGTQGDAAFSVQQTTDGGYIIAGQTFSFGAGNSDVWLIKTDENGDTLWTRTYGGTNYDNAYSVQQTSDGGYIIAGRTWSFGAGLTDVYVIKTDTTGDTRWTKTFGGTDNDYGDEVQQTTDGGYIIAGFTYSFGAGGCDVYLIKTETTGDSLWTRTYGGTNYDVGTSVQQTSDEGYIVAGYTYSFGVGGYDVYAVRTDSLGDSLWTKTYGGTDNDYGHSVQQTTDGGYIIAGYTSSFGAGDNDVWLIKTEPDPIGIEEEKLVQSSVANALYYSSPNPFKSAIQISYAIAKESRVNLVVYDVLGRQIKTLVNKKENSGYYEVSWNGEDDKGRQVPAGVYFVRLTISDESFAKKVIILK